MTVSTALSALNTPLVTGSLGTATALSLPTLQRICRSAAVAPWLNVLNLLAYTMCLYAVSQPGRLDGYQQQSNAASSQRKSKSNDFDLVEFMSLRRGRTLVAPAGWAFAIWAPIFLGELIGTVSSVVGSGLAVTSWGRSTPWGLGPTASAGFLAALVFQTLWAATFRPKYYISQPTHSISSFLSAFMLTGIALSLNQAHLAFTMRTDLSLLRYLMVFFPISLHFGWTTAASLVNWNGSLASSHFIGPRGMALVGWASVVAATLIGVGVTVTRRAPVYGAVIAWALAACANGMQERLGERDAQIHGQQSWWSRMTGKDEAVATSIRNQKGMLGARVQKWLCAIGSIISGCVAVVTAFVGRHST